MPEFTSYDGATLHYDVLGDTTLPALIVQGGGPARHPSYLGNLVGLDSARRLLVMHNRGVGESARADITGGKGAWDELAEDIEALRVHLGLDTVELLAHSAGTRTAVAYAARYPQRIARLALVTPPATWLVDEPDDSAAIVASHAGEDWFGAFQEALPAFQGAGSAAEANLYFPAIAPISFARWDATTRAHQGVGAWFAPAQDAFAGDGDGDTDHIREQLSRVTGETLVVAADRDGLVGFAPVIALAALFPNGTAAVIDDAGHYPWVEQPAAFARVMQDFFD